jgi:two-component system sensor histidine kinase DesK
MGAPVSNRVRLRRVLPSRRGRERTEGQQAAAPEIGLAWLTTVVALCCFAFIAVLNVLALALGRMALVASLACFAGIFVLQLAHSSLDVWRWPRSRRFLTLFAQAILTYLPFLWVGRSWGGMAGFLAGSVLLVVQGGTRWLLFAMVAVSVMVPSLLAGMGIIDVSYITVSTLLTGLIVYGLRRLASLLLEVHAARGELAQMAVTRERLRVARDLHDLLGYSLSAITLKIELAHRLLPSHPHRAQGEVADTLDIARQALADVRLVASGYRDMSLSAEARSAQSVLAAADIDIRIDISCGPLPTDIDTIMATVLREAVTNVLRHSKAMRCVIEAVGEKDTVRLTVRNDGVQSISARPLSNGSGLGNLANRLGSIGGHMSAGLREDGWFHATAVAPIPQVSIVSAD